MAPSTSSPPPCPASSGVTLLFAAAASAAISVAAVLCLVTGYGLIKLRGGETPSRLRERKKKKKGRKGLIGAIANTPLIRINSLSDATGCEILGKAELLNPGGSVKDRVAVKIIAVKIIEEALASGQLSPGRVVTEGSAGSTALSLATVAPTFGCRCHVVIPDDAAIEKNMKYIV